MKRPNSIGAGELEGPGVRFSDRELLGTKQLMNGQDREYERLWRKFREVLDLPEKDQRAISRMIQSLAAAKGGGRN